jgi:hypothetical protein
LALPTTLRFTQKGAVPVDTSQKTNFGLSNTYVATNKNHTPEIVYCGQRLFQLRVCFCIDYVIEQIKLIFQDY